ncbi:MAG TPA: YwiC-like family protein [Limnochordales bacterium]
MSALLPKRIIPREHGVWFMWLVPVLLGAVLGGLHPAHLLVLLSAFSVHLASHAALEAVREGGRGGPLWRWAAGMGAAAVALMAYPVWRFPVIVLFGAAAVAAFALNLYFARRRQERTLLNDALAIAGLELWGPVSYLVGSGRLDRDAGLLWLLCFVFFMGTAFHVKTVFRERDDPAFKRLSDLVHLGLLGLPALLGLPQMGWAYVPSALRTWLMPRRRRLRPLTVGLVEIGNAVLFMLLLAGLWPD